MANQVQKNQSEKIAKHLIKKYPGSKILNEIFEFAKEAYKEKFRLSGENYIEHAMRVAQMVSQTGADSGTVAFAMLHDILDDLPPQPSKKQLEEIEKRFGKEISFLIGRISELSKIRYALTVNISQPKSFSSEKLENLRRMFFALAQDVRVILVELISRIDGSNFLALLPQNQQKIFAMETLRVFAPVASRLGLAEIRRKLEDMSFMFIFPKRHLWLTEQLKEKYEEREKDLKKFIPRLKKILRKEKIRVFEINFRAKSHWSVYKKLSRKNMDFSKIHDLLALRVMVANVSDCYKALGILHKYFKPISEDIDDYIAKPKSNGYRSLHTTIYLQEGKISEVQIRTQKMHKEAEHGICAHWAYKEGIDLKKDKENLAWTQKIDFFPEKAFAFTPKGDIITLPKGASVVDFAYAIHSEIGTHCEAAKINGKIVTLSSQINNGDVVEIVTSPKKWPSHDWLNFVKTGLAKGHIKKHLEEPPTTFKIPIPGFIKKGFSGIKEKVRKFSQEKTKIKRERPREIYLAGQRGMLVHIAKCCSPHPDDKVMAYLTRHRAAVLHKTSCENFKRLAEKFPNKIIDASWK